MAHATPAPESPSPQQNRLLAAVSPEERERLYPHLQLVAMPLGKVLYEPGDTLRHVYFPTDSIVSLLYVLESGSRNIMSNPNILADFSEDSPASRSSMR